MYDTLIAYHTLELIRDSFLLSDSGMMKFIVFAMRILQLHQVITRIMTYKVLNNSYYNSLYSSTQE